MIVSHEHEFVFLKTRKTAGTSIEVALARMLGPDAIVTPLTPPVPGHEARNHDRPFNPIPEIVATHKWKRAYRDLRRHHTFHNHIGATLIRARLGPRRWNRYYKFCFDRDPWDKTISWYWFWVKSGDRAAIDFAEYVRNHPLPSDYDRYSIGGTVAVDFVGRYEHLEADLATALGEVGLELPAELTREKGGYRPDHSAVDELFTPELDRRVAEVFRREIELLGYPDRSVSAPGPEASGLS